MPRACRATSEGGTSSSSRGFCCSNFFSMISSLLRTSLLIPFHHNLACQGRDELLIKQASDPTSSVRPLHLSLAITDASSSLSTSSRSPCQTMSGFCSLFSTMTITNTYVTSSQMYFFTPSAHVHHGHKAFIITVK